MAEARLRMANTGEETIGGSWPETRQPSGSSPSRIGFSRVIVVLRIDARHLRNASACPGDMFPASFMLSPSRSCQSLPSAFRSTSTVAGSSSADNTTFPKPDRSCASSRRLDSFVSSLSTVHPRVAESFAEAPIHSLHFFVRLHTFIAQFQSAPAQPLINPPRAKLRFTFLHLNDGLLITHPKERQRQPSKLKPIRRCPFFDLK